MIYNKPKDYIFRVPDPKKTEKQSKKEKRKHFFYKDTKLERFGTKNKQHKWRFGKRFYGRKNYGEPDGHFSSAW